MNFDIPTLSNNYMTMAQLLRHNRDINKELVTGIFYNQGFYSQGIYKKILVIVYKLFSRLFPHNPRFQKEQRLTLAMHKTNQSFTNHAEELKRNVEKCEEHLKMVCAGVNLTTAQMDQWQTAKKTITHWNNWMLPLLKKELYPQLDKLVDLVDRTLGKKEENSTKKAWIEYSPIFEKAENLQHFIDLEKDSHHSLPIPQLANLAKGNELGIMEKQVVAAWISEINRLAESKPLIGRQINVRYLHSGLKSIVQMTPSTLGNPLAHLEGELKQLGCKVFDQIDREHILWRDKVAKELLIKEQIEGKKWELVLEPPLGKVNDRTAQHMIFPLKEDSKKVLVIGYNEASSGLEEWHHWKFGPPTPLPVACLEQVGRFKIMEREKIPLQDYAWKSTSSELDLEDLAVAKLLASMIEKMIKGAFTPTPLTPFGMFFDVENGVIKTSKPLVYDLFRYHILTKFVLDCANGNEYVHAYLVKQSGLENHPSYHFCHDVAKDIINTGASQLIKIAKDHHVKNANLYNLGADLDKKLFELRRECLVEVEKLHCKPNMELLVRKAILDCYERGLLAGHVWPDMKERVMKEACRVMSNES